MSIIKNWFDDALNKNYRVCYEVERTYEVWVSGKLINYNGGNIILYDEKKNNLYHIPYKGIKWLLPLENK